jgi:hypothetical protein
MSLAEDYLTTQEVGAAGEASESQGMFITT